MPRIVVIGGGIGGLGAAMLLVADGHDVTLLERDPEPPPGSATEAWERWERRGVNQFRLLHYIQPRFRELAAAELPGVTGALDEIGALRLNPISLVPAQLSGGAQPGDERFEALTARRPVFEAALARAAGCMSGLTIQRGTAVAGLRTDGDRAQGFPHVTGVRTETGDDLPADLVVDASGRRSALPSWLAAIGARPPVEEKEDSGFVYYGRHLRSPDRSTPPMLGPLLQHYGSVSMLTLPADNGTWGIGFITSARDRAARALRDVERWEAAWRAFPLVAHWLDGEPLSDTVDVMAKIEDRERRYCVDGEVAVTGVVAVADSWSCTNPSLGRGATIGLLHAVALRDLLRDHPVDDPLGFARAFEEATDRMVRPWYRATLHYDRHRLAEMEATVRGEPYDVDDPAWEITRALQHAAGLDGELLRGFLRIAGLLDTIDDVLAAPGFHERAAQVGADWRTAETPGPDRAELLEILGA